MNTDRIQIVLLHANDHLGRLTEDYVRQSGLAVEAFYDPSRVGAPLLRVVNGMMSRTFEGYQTICTIVSQREVMETQGRAILRAAD